MTHPRSFCPDELSKLAKLVDVSITLCCSLDTSVDAMDKPRARIYRQEYHHGLNNIVSAEFPTELRFDGAANWCFATF